MENKDRTQASYQLYDGNAIAQAMFEKCKKTKEQKIEELKKTMNIFKSEKSLLLKMWMMKIYFMCINR